MNFSHAVDRRFTLEKTRLPLIALIDVVLFLLLYFMLSGSLAADQSLLQSSLQTQKGGGGSETYLVTQVLHVTTEAGTTQFRVGDRVCSDRAALAALLAQLPQKNGIIIQAALGTHVADVAAALQVSKDAGFEKVSYVAGR